ncbi:TPA: hypothetical protein ACGB3D_005578 [Citrobacter freundii]|jgi:hypothetical protein
MLRQHVSGDLEFHLLVQADVARYDHASQGDRAQECESAYHAKQLGIPWIVVLDFHDGEIQEDDREQPRNCQELKYRHYQLIQKYG